LLETLQDKFVTLGKNEKYPKLLILDMDETMLHAKFLTTDEDALNDDGDF